MERAIGWCCREPIRDPRLKEELGTYLELSSQVEGVTQKPSQSSQGTLLQEGPETIITVGTLEAHLSPRVPKSNS